MSEVIRGANVFSLIVEELFLSHLPSILDPLHSGTPGNAGITSAFSFQQSLDLPKGKLVLMSTSTASSESLMRMFLNVGVKRGPSVAGSLYLESRNPGSAWLTLRNGDD